MKFWFTNVIAVYSNVVPLHIRFEKYFENACPMYEKNSNFNFTTFITLRIEFFILIEKMSKSGFELRSF